MKNFQPPLLFNLVLVCLLVFSSCSTHKQVACLPIEKNKNLARKPDRPKYKPPKRKKYSFSSNYKRLHANKTSKKTVIFNNPKQTPKSQINYIKISPISSLNSFTDYDIKTEELLIASTEANLEYVGSSYDITKLSRIDDINKSMPISSIEPMNQKEQRQFNRDIKRELRRNTRSVNQELSQADSKPAEGYAIASMVLGLTSLFILPLLFGTVAIVFSVIALSRIKINPELDGKGMAIAGLVLGIAGIIALLLLVAIVV